MPGHRRKTPEEDRARQPFIHGRGHGTCIVLEKLGVLSLSFACSWMMVMVMGFGGDRGSKKFWHRICKDVQKRDLMPVCTPVRSSSIISLSLMFSFVK
jgi:hypothetical protein